MDDPISLLRAHYERATASEPFDASRAALATVDAEGRPEVRFVLVRQIEPTGLYFYTNYESDKALELASNPHASVVFHWWTLGVQARVAGEVRRATPERSDAYFASRERESQIGAWASDQSRPLESREALEARVKEVTERFAAGEVPRPLHWGGYEISPRRIELWQEGDHRLHDRFRYDRDGDTWRMTRLMP